MKNIIFSGVGGQGVILASKVLMEVAKNAGYDVKESEVHGMAQRGGSVECNVRYGEKVFSPLIPKEQADVIVSFEKLEAVRKIPYLSPEGKLIVNDLQIDPVPVTIGAMKYPETINQWITTTIPRHHIIDTAGILKDVGNKKALNIVMLGVLSGELEFDVSSWHNAIGSLVKEAFVEMNIKAFNLGREAAGK